MPYSKISCLKDELDVDKSIQTNIKRPKRAPQNRDDLVEIRVVGNSQGKNHIEIIEQAISYCDGTVAGKLVQGNDGFKAKFADWFNQIWFPTIFIYPAIVIPTLSYDSGAITSDPIGLGMLLGSAIPTALGLATTPILARKIHR